LKFKLAGFGLRCVVRCYKAEGSKRDSLRSVRGTVLSDLTGGPGRDSELNILLSQFTQWNATDRIWKYSMFMNSAPSDRPETAERIPPILRNMFVVGEMLDEEEHAKTSGSIEIYEEL
jgi:hypothetical protein